MAVRMPGYPSQSTTATARESEHVSMESQCHKGKWYFSRQELEYDSPSRKDGIEFEKESELRKLYCSFLRELGMELKVPQVTISASMVLCHRFYTRQSHAKNDWQTVATVCMFLACKSEETPRWLSDVTVVAYKLMYKWDPSAAERIKQKDVFEKQKKLLLIGERLLLSTIAYDLNIELPYKPLVAALKRLEISNKELGKVAWNFVNDWLRTSLCLQYKPHYIAAGSMFLAAKFQQVKLPSEMGRVWWMQFDVAPKQLEEVVQAMLQYLEKKRVRAMPPSLGKSVGSKTAASKSVPNIPLSTLGKVVEPEIAVSIVNQNKGHGSIVKIGASVEPAYSDSPQSCVLSGSHVGRGSTVDDGTVVKSAPSNCSDYDSANSVVKDGNGEHKTGDRDPNPSSKIVSVELDNKKIDVNRIREAMKRRRLERSVNKQAVKVTDDDNDICSEAWIERELENGIELDLLSNKRMRV